MIATALTLLAASSVPTTAATAPPPIATQTDPAALTAARGLMKASDLQGQMKAMGPSMARAVEQQVKGMFADAALPEGLQKDMTEAIKTHLASMDAVFTPELMDEMAAIYARHFSADDLTRLTAMMDDPVMVRFRNSMPNLMGELLPTMMKAMQPRQKAFQARMMSIVRDWIQSHPEDKAKLRSPISS